MSEMQGAPPRPPHQSQIRPIDTLRGPAGRLEAMLNTGSPDAPFAAVIAHPHPPSGGTMHNKVVYHAAKVFSSFGLPVLRFNFRSAGLSEGEHDYGDGEQDDLRAALDWAHRELGLPLLFAGFSFGAAVGMRVCCAPDANPQWSLAGLIALGLPLSAAGRNYTHEYLAHCSLPKLFILGDHDQFAPRELLEPILADAAPPSEVVWIDQAEHFFGGIPGSPASKLPAMRTSLETWLVKWMEHSSFGNVYSIKS
jgi:alpha/beta superfamily hydrolase